MTERTLLESRQSSFSLLPYCISDILPSQVNNLQVICGNRMHVGMIFPCLMFNIEAAFAPAVHRSSMLDFLPDCRWLRCGDWQFNKVFIWVNGLLSLMRYSLTCLLQLRTVCAFVMEQCNLFQNGFCVITMWGGDANTASKTHFCSSFTPELPLEKSFFAPSSCTNKNLFVCLFWN